MRHLLFAFCLLVTASCYAQPGYNLKFKVDGWKDTTVYLGHYYGESTYLKDTARANAKGEFTFTGKKELAHGVYFLVLDKSKIFDFVISKSQHFSMETKTDDYIKHMKITGDADNRLFFDNMLFNMERHKEAEPFIKVIQDSTIAEDKKKEARAAFAKVNEKVVAYQTDVAAKNPGTMTAAIFKSKIGRAHV